MDIIKGKVVYKLPDDINTDKILAGRYLLLTGDEELAAHCFEGHIKDWNEKVKKGDILVAGENFGCGSSREHAPIALKGSGIVAVIAESFGRIFYRNSIAVGLPVIHAPEISRKVEEGDIMEIEVDNGKATNTRTKEVISFDPFPDFIQAYLSQGGLSNYIRNRLIKKRVTVQPLRH
jgi:3-isopropylmalate/(R)-2-methylmalate dehydratase small subunit